jgi:hypothetical protein
VQGSGNVWRQHLRHFRSIGCCGNPRQLFGEDPCAALKVWRRGREYIIVAGDLNNDIYTGSLAHSLTHYGIGLQEQFHKLFDEPALFRHTTRAKPTMRVYATAGIVVTAAFLSKNNAKGTVGDHWLHVLNVKTVSITGLDTPTVKQAKGRNLQCKDHYGKTNYVRVLMQLTKRHKMFSKALFLQHQRLSNSPTQFQLAYNKYDKELVELMLAGEAVLQASPKLSQIISHCGCPSLASSHVPLDILLQEQSDCQCC